MNVRSLFKMPFTVVLILSARCLATTPSAHFDHSTNADTNQAVAADSGDTITITIDNTCPDKFDYAQRGLLGTTAPTTSTTTAASHGAGAPAAPPPPGTCDTQATDAALQAMVDEKLGSENVCKATSTNLFITHEAKYGGYNILITGGFGS